MTRINSGIRPIELCDAHLLAEKREIVRIPNTIKSGKAKVNLSKIPKSFGLGKGHVTHYYNKLKYLHNRYLEIHRECIERGFKVQNYNECFLNLPAHLYNDWYNEEEAREEVKERINLRLSTMKRIKYYSEDIDLKFIQL